MKLTTKEVEKLRASWSDRYCNHNCGFGHEVDDTTGCDCDCFCLQCGKEYSDAEFFIKRKGCINILVTGAKGFVGKNLVANLKNIKENKNRTRPNIKIDEIYEYDIDTEHALLDTYCERADFVFNLAGVNRPKDTAEFMQGNFGFANTLLDTLKKHNSTITSAR